MPHTFFLNSTTLTILFVVANISNAQDPAAIPTNVNSIREVLTKSLQTLDGIKSFECTTFYQASGAFDTSSIVTEYYKKYVGVVSVEDSLVGARYLLYWKDTTQIYSVEDSQYTVKLDWYNQKAQIIDYAALPKQGLSRSSPYLIQARTLIDFVLNSEEVEIIPLYETEDTLVVDFRFNFNRYEFVQKKVMKQGRHGRSSSVYTVWLSKDDYLPVKMYRKQQHQVSIEEIVHVVTYETPHIEINALESIPETFTVTNEGFTVKEPDVEGQAAPAWNLKDVSGSDLQLDDFLGKTLLLEFTSVGCGPCYLAIPYLKELYSEYKEDQLAIVTIEAYFTRKPEALLRFAEKNDLPYPLLVGTKEVIEDYQVPAVPYFLIIDQTGIIKHSFLGFKKETTPSELREAIKKSLN